MEMLQSSLISQRNFRSYSKLGTIHSCNLVTVLDSVTETFSRELQSTKELVFAIY